jgi:putative oxidoreductase
MSLFSMRFLSPLAGLGWLIVRLTAGVILVLHGYHKLTGGNGVSDHADYLRKEGVPVPELSAWLSTGAELVGGALLALGLFTRPVGLVIAIQFFAATWIAHREQLKDIGSPQGGGQAALLLLAIGLCAMFQGAGKLSLDAIFQRAPRGSNLPPTR